MFCIEKFTVSHIVKEIIFPTCPFLWNSWATSLIHQSLTHSPQTLLSRHVMEWNRKESSDRKLGFQSNGGGGHPRDIAFNIYFSECLSKQVQYNFRVQLNKVGLSWTVVHSASTSSLLPILAVVSRTESGGPPFNWGGGAMRQSKSSCKRSFYAVTCYCWLGEFNLPVCWFVICC